MPATRYMNYIYYMGDEIRYGGYLYYAGWKKLLLHPWQTIKDTAYAMYHPRETAKNIVYQIKQHPIGMAVNLSLSWGTGYAISKSIDYFVPEVEVAGEIPTAVEMQNSTKFIEASLASSVSQAVQISGQAMSGGCCGGVCTIGRIGQTTSVVTSQSLSSDEVRRQPTHTSAKNQSSFSILRWWQGSSASQKVCNDACAATPCDENLSGKSHTL